MSDTAATQTQMEHAPGTFSLDRTGNYRRARREKVLHRSIRMGRPGQSYGARTWSTRSTRSTAKTSRASYQKGEEMKQVPTHWACYVAVKSADETAAKAKSLGGTVVQEPFDVMDHGRMAAITDPTGATFCIWQPNQHKGVGIKNENNSCAGTS